MSPQIPNITDTPQQVAEGIAQAKSTKSFATGKVTLAILVHNEDNDFLLYSTFNQAQDANASPCLGLDHILGHEIDLQPFAADDEADVSLKAITEDAITAKLGPVDVKNMTVLHACREAQTARTIIFVACMVQSSEIPEAFMADLQWLPETVLANTDLKNLIALLGVDGMGSLLGTREQWKQRTSLGTIPDLVSGLPIAPAHMVTGEGKVQADEDFGYQPDSESSTATDEARDISDIDGDYTLEVEDDDDMPELIRASDVVFGDEDLAGNGTAKGKRLTHHVVVQPRRRTIPSSSPAADSDNDDDKDDFPQNRKKPSKSEKTQAGRRVFQVDATLVRGGRVPRKQQKNPPLMVDPLYHHEGPRFARPAQTVDGRRFRTKISRSKISMATDAAIKDDHHLWDDLFRVSPEMRLA